MLPYLRQGDLDGAIRVAMARVDAATTPSHAQSLERARQVNALLGLVGAPVIFLLLAGWAVVVLGPPRARPAIPRRPLDLRRRASGGPHARERRARPRRRVVAAGR